MRKIVLAALALTLFVVSCKKEEKIPEETTSVRSGLNIVSDSTKVNWTAYKTTDKVAVGGSFTQIDIKDLKSGQTPQEVLEGARFAIPISSIFTNNPDRDGKLKEFFFMVMKDPEFLAGEIHTKNGVTTIFITINSITKEIPVTTSYENKKYSVNGVLNLEDFNAQEALASINKACYDLHKGADGVSKTWSEVAISGSILFE